MSLMSLPDCDDATFGAIFRAHAPSAPSVAASGDPWFDVEIPGVLRQQWQAPNADSAMRSMINAMQLPGTPERYGMTAVEL